jgi:hypothetical protein
MQGVYSNAYQPGTYWGYQAPILFSNDGSHNAYIGKVGDEYVVMEDGAELARGPLQGSGGNITVPLEFSPGGKHLFYMTVDATGKYAVVADGKPGPGSGFPGQLVISPDGEHYAYTGFEHGLGNGVPNWAVVDGRQVNYFGDELQYTARNTLVSRMAVDGATILLFNGKPALKAYGIGRLFISPDGAELATVITPRSGEATLLTVNGKAVPAAGGLPVLNVYFSADGKRWAALCATKTGSQFMIIDGKKGDEYQNIQQQISTPYAQHWGWANGTDGPGPADTPPPVPGFTADSSKFVYVAKQGGRQFMVVDDDESDPFDGSDFLAPVLSRTGNRIAVIGKSPDGKEHVLVDGKEVDYPAANGARCSCFTFSSGGKRYAFVSGQTLVVDGVAMPGINSGLQYAFSPDDRHVAYLSSNGGPPLLFLDGKVIDDSPTAGRTTRAFFSPDGNHLFTLNVRNLYAMGTKDSTLLSVDGKPATHYGDAGANGSSACNFEFGPDGVLSFVARTDGKLRLFHVTPAPDADITTLLASAKAPSAK